MRINIIADIAGRYDEMLLLIKKMPEADLILSVGDMMDRGPKSRQVIEFFMNTPNTEALYGNHEDMMVEAALGVNLNDWFRNGGIATAKNFLIDPNKECHYFHELMQNVYIPEDMIGWLQKRPMYFQTDDLFVSHAPITSLEDIPEDPYQRDHLFIWNRYEPRKPQAKFLVNGHNSRFREYKLGDGTIFGMCIDNCSEGELIGLHWPSKEIFRQEYLDKKE